MRRQTRLPSGLASGAGAAAAGAPDIGNATAQPMPVTLRWSLAKSVLALTATTPWRGASYRESWSVSPSLDLAWTTVAEASVAGQTSHLSRAAVDASSLAHDTTYTFSYAILMRTFERVWVGGGSVALTVGSDGSLSEIAITCRV